MSSKKCCLYSIIFKLLHFLQKHDMLFLEDYYEM